MHYKTALRKATDTALGLVPSPLARYLLKSYGSRQSLRNRVRFHVQAFNYFSPIADISEVDLPQLLAKRDLGGLLPELSTFDSLLEQFKPFAAEVKSFPKKAGNETPFWFHNFSYEDMDAVTLYSMLRHLKPKRMIEVGCGFSSRMTTIAANKNAAEGSPLDAVFIEPYPAPYLLNYKLCGPLLVQKIQQVPLDRFAQLESGDILFIDTSHVLKTQNDLCYILLHILPRLAKGVYIHFHDIFTPYDYPESWLLQTACYYNEQYALEAILRNSDNFEVILPVYALWRDRHEKLVALLPDAEISGAAFWIRKNP